MIDPGTARGEAAFRQDKGSFKVTKRTNTGFSARGTQAAGMPAWTGLAALWCDRLGDLATLCAGSFADEEAERVHALHDLLAHAPDPGLIVGLELPAPDHFACLMAAPACAAAVLTMFGPSAGYLLSRGATGLHAASVYLPEAAEDVTAIGDSAALALVGAIAQALVDRHARREPAVQLN